MSCVYLGAILERISDHSDGTTNLFAECSRKYLRKDIKSGSQDN